MIDRRTILKTVAAAASTAVMNPAMAVVEEPWRLEYVNPQHAIEVWIKDRLTVPIDELPQHGIDENSYIQSLLRYGVGSDLVGSNCNGYIQSILRNAEI